MIWNRQNMGRRSGNSSRYTLRWVQIRPVSRRWSMRMRYIPSGDRWFTSQHVSCTLASPIIGGSRTSMYRVRLHLLNICIWIQLEGEVCECGDRGFTSQHVSCTLASPIIIFAYESYWKVKESLVYTWALPWRTFSAHWTTGWF
jgi:hypothetical protein